ncbi:MAG: hypothetical protein ACNFW9_02710 [Candidatus Kerfeldbacteria bacterium]
MKTILVDAINCFVIKEEGIFKSLYKMLDKYPNKKIILTGANDEEMEKFGLDKMPYEVFTMKHDPEKTDPKYYKTLLDKLNLKAEDVVYFEHDEKAAESARSVGIQTHVYESEKQDLIALEVFFDIYLD